MSASEFKEINKEDRHFLLTCSFPHNGGSYFRNFHYVRKNGASLPPLREIRHSLRTFLQPNPRTLDIISLCEIDNSEASIFFEGMQEPLPF